MGAKTTLSQDQIALISEALDDAESFYELFDNDNEGRGEIIRRGLDALRQAGSPCAHDAAPAPIVRQ
jgi:hypothetical protein